MKVDRKNESVNSIIINDVVTVDIILLQQWQQSSGENEEQPTDREQFLQRTTLHQRQRRAPAISWWPRPNTTQFTSTSLPLSTPLPIKCYM